MLNIEKFVENRVYTLTISKKKLTHHFLLIFLQLIFHELKYLQMMRKN